MNQQGSSRRWVKLVMVLTVVGLIAFAYLFLQRDRGDDRRVCRKGSGAEVCLVTRGPAYRLEGKGFAPGDDVRIVFGSEQPLVLRADSEGRVPGRTGAVAGFLPGDRPSLITVMGNGASGEAVYLELTACGTSASGRRVC